jgi:ADP-ribose pyrophosphatase
MDTVYSVAFKDDCFLMVYNPKRRGWEMPGGHIEVGESIISAAKREFAEEAGYNIDVVDVKRLEGCSVCACSLLEMIDGPAEMMHRLFKELPADLAFERTEYESVIPWAYSSVQNKEP